MLFHLVCLRGLYGDFLVSINSVAPTTMFILVLVGASHLIGVSTTGNWTYSTPNLVVLRTTTIFPYSMQYHGTIYSEYETTVLRIAHSEKIQTVFI